MKTGAKIGAINHITPHNSSVNQITQWKLGKDDLATNRSILKTATLTAEHSLPATDSTPFIALCLELATNWRHLFGVLEGGLYSGGIECLACYVRDAEAANTDSLSPTNENKGKPVINHWFAFLLFSKELQVMTGLCLGYVKAYNYGN